MGNVVNLFAPERYCMSAGCNRVDCDFHCWNCGTDHDQITSPVPWCKACEIELAEEDNDLGGFWNPTPEQEPSRRKHSIEFKHVGSTEELLICIGNNWVKNYFNK